MDVACIQGGDGTSLVSVPGGWENRVFAVPPLRWWPAGRVWLRHEVFDRAVARRLPPVDEVTAFMGAAEHTFRKARAMGARKLVLEMPNSHPSNVRALHARASRMHPLESTWMGSWFQRKALREMALADEIRTNSDYTSRSLLERGIEPSRIVRRHLGCDPRFGKVERRPHPEGLRVAVFVGSLTVFKGVPFLVDIFRRIPGDRLRLLLVGGWTDRPMRLWLQKARQADPRIGWTSGDPVPHFSTASLAVHPSWEDGWGYAPAEALAAGVPLVVSDQTGMQELGATGRFDVLPAGDEAAWEARLRAWAEEPS